MDRSRTVSTTPFLIFIIAHIIIGLFFLALYTRNPGFEITLSNAATFVTLWPLFLAGWLAGTNFAIYFATLALLLMDVFFQTRLVYIAGKSRIKLLDWPVNRTVQVPFLGLLATHAILLTIELLGTDPKFGISPWTLVPSAFLAAPIAIFLIYRGLISAVPKRDQLS